METTRFPFMHYVDDEMYRVTYSQADHYAGLDARTIKQLSTLSRRKLCRHIDNHLEWKNRMPTPFVSVWSDEVHAHRVATLVARDPHTRRNSVSVSRFLSSGDLMINVEEYVRYRGLEMKSYYRHEWLVPDGIFIDNVLDVTFIYTDEKGNVYMEGDRVAD